MKTVLRSLLIAFSLIVVWHIIVNVWDLPDYILPCPQQVLTALQEQYKLIFKQTIPTLYEMMIGFFGGITFGCIVGGLIAYFRPLKRWFLPLMIASQAIPTFVIAPLLVIWLGYGLASKIVTTILMIFFPVASAFYDGLCNTNSGWLELAKTMNANRFRVFCHICIPAALPSLACGIRIAAVIAPVGTIIGEWVGSSRGLGYLILNANARMQIDVMFAALLIIVLLSLLLYFSVDKLLHKLVWWDA